jgi:hypothetical protein
MEFQENDCGVVFLCNTSLFPTSSTLHALTCDNFLKMTMGGDLYFCLLYASTGKYMQRFEKSVGKKGF